MLKINTTTVLDEAAPKVSGAIADLINLFNTEIEKAIRKVSSAFMAENKLKIGYDKQAFNNHISNMERQISLINSITKDYQSIFPNKKANVELLNTIRETLSDNDVESALKKLYIKANNISIPSFPSVRIDKLIELYDYPENIEASILSIVASASELHGINNKFDYLFNTEQGELVLSQEEISNQMEEFALYITQEDVGNILSLHLFCVGLDNSRGADYSFDSLPEIDYRIMSKIKKDVQGSIIVDILAIEQQLSVSSPRLPTIKINKS